MSQIITAMDFSNYFAEKDKIWTRYSRSGYHNLIVILDSKQIETLTLLLNKIEVYNSIFNINNSHFQIHLTTDEIDQYVLDKVYYDYEALYIQYNNHIESFLKEKLLEFNNNELMDYSMCTREARVLHTKNNLYAIFEETLESVYYDLANFTQERLREVQLKQEFEQKNCYFKSSQININLLLWDRLINTEIEKKLYYTRTIEKAEAFFEKYGDRFLIEIFETRQAFLSEWFKINANIRYKD